MACCLLGWLGRLSGFGGSAALALLAAAACGAGLQQRQRLLERDRLRRYVGRQRGVDAVVTHVGSIAPILHHHRATLVGMIAQRASGIGAEAALAGHDRLAVVRMLADFARQRQESERAVKIDVLGGYAFGQARALGLLAVDLFAELQIGAEAAGAQRDFKPSRRISAELLVGRSVGPGRKLPRIAAFRIIGAADEAAEPAEL